MIWAVLVATALLDLRNPAMGQSRSELTSRDTPRLEFPFFMAVEDVFTVRGLGTTVSGTPTRGSISVGEEVEIVGNRKSIATVVTAISVNRTRVETAAADGLAGITLRGVRKRDLERGMLLVERGSFTLSKAFRVAVTLDRTTIAEVFPQGMRIARVSVFLHRADRPADLVLFDETSFSNGTDLEMVVDLEDPTVIAPNMKLALRNNGRTFAEATVQEILF